MQAHGVSLSRVARIAAAAALLGLGVNAWSQAKPEEEPFWAKGRPKGDAAAKMAPVPAFPIPTPADKLPVAKMKLPPGFKAEVYASNILDARGLREGVKRENDEERPGEQDCTAAIADIIGVGDPIAERGSERLRK